MNMMEKLLNERDDVVALDVRYTGVEGGRPRLYAGLFPCVTARDYKDPLRVMYYERRNTNNSSSDDS